MGPEYKLLLIEIIDGGLLQFDIENTETKEQIRFFVEPYFFFELFGTTLQKSRDVRIMFPEEA